MQEYTVGKDGFKMADGTHKITKNDMTFVFWMVIDCLLKLKSKFVGYTANFTENSDVVIDGADAYFQHEHSSLLLEVDCNKMFVGGIPGYFDPFVDNEIVLDADATPASKVLSNEAVPLSLTCKSPCSPDVISYSPAKTAFMTDEGSAFPSVAERFGWTHLLDCRHFTLQILSAWHGLSDPKQFQSDVYDILDTPSAAILTSLLKQALAKYRTEKAQVFLMKIYKSNINFATLIPVPLSQLGMFQTRGWSKEWLNEGQWEIENLPKRMHLW
jgi:hypothetical protein